MQISGYNHVSNHTLRSLAMWHDRKIQGSEPGPALELWRLSLLLTLHVNFTRYLTSWAYVCGTILQSTRTLGIIFTRHSGKSSSSSWHLLAHGKFLVYTFRISGFK